MCLFLAELTNLGALLITMQAALLLILENELFRDTEINFYIITYRGQMPRTQRDIAVHKLTKMRGNLRQLLREFEDAKDAPLMNHLTGSTSALKTNGKDCRRHFTP